MLGSLYKLCFIGTPKVYIGKTYESLNSRLKDHIRNVDKFPNRKLSKAILKYGIPSIELIGTWEQGQLEVEEILHIKKFDSYNNGYNSTLGGDGKRYVEFSDKEIIDCFKQSKSIIEVSNRLNIDTATVSKILKANNIDKKKPKVDAKRVKIVELDLLFDSGLACAKYLIDNGYTKSDNPRAVAPNITRVCNGIRKSAYKLTFLYQ